jgi:hypothetical protein
VIISLNAELVNQHLHHESVAQVYPRSSSLRRDKVNVEIVRDAGQNQPLVVANQM